MERAAEVARGQRLVELAPVTGGCGDSVGTPRSRDTSRVAYATLVPRQKPLANRERDERASKLSRGDWIRTSDLYVPNVAL